MGRPMPEEIRHTLRGRQSPARGVECPHCGAAAHRPCRSQSRTHLLPEPHPSRVAAWATAVAVCPACQVEPGTPCHNQGRPLHDHQVHAQRLVEAERSAS